MLRKILVRSGLAPFLLTAMAAVNVGADVYQTDFSSLPPGATLVGGKTDGPSVGSGTIADGVLRLTVAENSGWGVFYTPVISSPVQTYVISYSAYLGGGTCCGDPLSGNPTSAADGYSVNIANDLPGAPGYGNPGEEGAGSGLSVNFDTWDNGGGEAPSIEIKWQGNVLVRQKMSPHLSQGAGTPRFIPVQITVDGVAGTANVQYDGTNVFGNVPLPGYAPVSGLRVGFGARTGGANDNHWIDDLKIVTQSPDIALLGVDTSDWKYLVNGADPAFAPFDAWTAPGFDDSAWLSGRGLFGTEPTIATYAPWVINTPAPIASAGGHSLYFRSRVNWSGETAGVTLTFTNYMDDGILVWLNGVELFGFNVPDTRPLSYNADYTLPAAANPLGEGVPFITNVVPANLVVGENIIAVALYQHGSGSSDSVFGMSAKAKPSVPPTIIDDSGLVGGVVFANQTKTLSVAAIASPAASYQWYLDGTPIDLLTNPTANSAAYVITTMQPADEGSYFVRISNAAGTTDSRTVTLTYVNDVTAPVVTGASSDSFMNTVVVQFDEFVDPNSASDLFSYSISPAISITGASRRADGRSVLLTLDGVLTPDTDYTVTVTGVADLAGNPMTSGDATFHTYVFAQGWVLKEYFRDYTAGVDALIADAGRLATPNLATLTNLWEMNAADQFDNYGGRISGFFIANEDGPHTFYISTDDPGRLFISTDENPANKVLVASEPTWAGRRQWTGIPGDGSGVGRENPSPSGGPAANVTGPINMVKGQRYYVESYFTEGGGGDNMAITVQPPSVATVPPNGSQPLGSFNMGSFVPRGEGTVAITTQPTAQTVLENANATFTVAGNGSFRGLGDVSFSWERSDDGGTTWNAVAVTTSKTGSSVTIPVVTIANDNGDLYRVRAFVPGASVTSDSVALSVTTDVIAPTIVGAAGSSDMRSISISFSELMVAGSLADLFNYSVDGGLSVTAAAPGADGKSVVLTVDPAMTEDTTYTVTVDNVTDLATNPIQAGTTVSFRSFVFSAGFLSLATYEGIGTVAVSALTSDPRYPNSPTRRFFLGGFDTRLALPTDSLENFGGRIDGFFVPPSSGNWILYLRSDDASELWMDLNDGAGMVKVQEETGCCRAFSAIPTAPLALTGGQRYAIMGLYKEAGGGDYMQVAAKLESDPTPPDTLRPIAAPLLGTFVSGAGVSITATTQPEDQTFLIIPPSAGAGTPILDENFTSGNGGFTASTPGAFQGTPFTYDGGAGSWQVNQDAPENNAANTTRLDSPAISIARAGYAILSFSHRWSLESSGGNWDGVGIQVSVNGGAFTSVPASAFTAGGYNGTVVAGASVLQNQQAFVGESANHQGPGYVDSSANLGFFSAGDNVVVRFLYAGDTNTRGPNTPSWEITSVKLTDGSAPTTVTFNFAATAVVPGNANPPVFYQWSRGGNVIPGANGTSYTFSPVLADNGATFTATAYTLGGNVVSRTATLTVAQPNTPPQFVGGPDQSADCGSAVTVQGWATDIKNHSIGRAPVLYGSDFNSLPPGSVAGGTAVATGGILHLTDAANDRNGNFATPAVSGQVESLTVTFKALIGGGTCCGNRTADGWSVSIGDIALPVAFPVAAEEGTGNGLVVSFDSWDNGGLDDAYTAPNVDAKVGGTVVAYQAFDGDREGGRAPSGPLVTDPATGLPMSYKTGTEFTDVRIHLDADGTLDVDFKGVRVIDNAATGLTLPLINPRLVLAARTGGANDNHWIDDLAITAQLVDASSVEAAQTVQFLVNNDNNALFSVQPAIAPDGTLTYALAPGVCGSANVTVVAQDNGGTAFGGRDTSAPYTFTISTALDTIPPVLSGCLANTSIPATGPNGAVFTYASPTATDNCCLASVVCAPTSGSLLPVGQTVVTCTAVDAAANSASCSFVVTVLPIDLNRAPTAQIDTDALVDFSPDFEHPVLISCNWWNACLILDGSLSSDPDQDALSYLWFIEPSPVPFAAGPVATNCLEVGVHTVVLTVTDPDGASDSDSLTIEVLTAPLAIELLMEKVNESRVTRAIKRELLAVLRTALNQSKNERIRPTQTTLDAFEKKVRAKVTAGYPADAAAWIRWSQAISSGMEKCIKAPVVKKDYKDDKK